MTKLLVSPNNPDGWKLEDIIDEIQNDIVRRTARIVDDNRPEARAVLHNKQFGRVRSRPPSGRAEPQYVSNRDQPRCPGPAL